MKLDDLDFANDIALLSHTQQQMYEKTISVAAASAVGLNIHKQKCKILRYNTACDNRITLHRGALDDVKTFTYLGSLINEHGGSNAVVRDQQSKISISTIEEHLERKTTVNQLQGQNYQYKFQDSSTVCCRNLKNYESHHLEDTSIY
ncbi:unnamed protein product [Schistosoma margrebowiei]|uniref:Uncharacterized protein n=1 Tax=Schistosoma margrebowiei TaxID=48269 RepID=A0A183MRY0_9TREM|nr:unnamed protein product [Schistosoma margrebowiei]